MRRGTTTSAWMVALCFDSSGWLYLYHFGVAKYLQQHCDLSSPDIKYFGSSAGSLVAAVLLLGIDIDEVVEQVLSHIECCQANPFHMIKAVEDTIEALTPDDAHLQCSNRLFISLTNLSWRNASAWVFTSRTHLLQCLRASCHIPLIGGILPYHIQSHLDDEEVGQVSGYFYDGGFSERVPDPEVLLPGLPSVRVSARGLLEADIRNDMELPWSWAVLPPDKPALMHLFHLGYQHAHDFMQDSCLLPRISDRSLKNRPRASSNDPGNAQDIRRHIHVIIQGSSARRQYSSFLLTFLYMVRMYLAKYWLLALAFVRRVLKS